MEVFENMNHFQNSLIDHVTHSPDVEFTVEVKKKKQYYSFVLITKVTNVSHELKLFISINEQLLLEEPLALSLTRIKQRHFEKLKHESERQDAKLARVQLLNQRAEEQKIRNQKILKANAFKSKNRLHKIIKELDDIYIDIESSTISSGQSLIQTWSKGDGEHSEHLSLARVYSTSKINDMFDVTLVEESINYGEHAMFDSTTSENVLICERYQDTKQAIERCKAIITTRMLLD